MNGHTDLDLSEDVLDLNDWRSKQSFDERRHTEDIKAPDIVEEKWRMKERVSNMIQAQALLSLQPKTPSFR